MKLLFRSILLKTTFITSVMAMEPESLLGEHAKINHLVITETFKDRDNAQSIDSQSVDISAYGLKITDEILIKVIEFYPSLASLKLSSCWNITIAGFAHLQSLNNLTCLNLSGTGITDEESGLIGSLITLTSLNLKRALITDSGLVNIGQLTNLTSLHLGITEITNAGLKELAPLTKLTSLNLANNKISNAGVKHLTPLTNLTTLNLANTSLTDAVIESLMQLPNLSLLNLRITYVTWSGLRTLRGLRRTLHVDGGYY